MAINCADEKCVQSDSIENEEEEEEEEEEALSLSDLPVNEENQSRKEEAQPIETLEDFDFGSWGESVLTKSEICAADEVFFQGQILPLRNSVTSETDSAGLRSDDRNPIPCLPRSESLDNCHSGGSTTVTSRSSSMGSHHSSSNGSSGTTTTSATSRYKPRLRNQFHSHPSPTPQILFSSIQQGNIGHSGRKSTAWSFFRVGLLRTPEIELADLKVRTNNTTANKTFGSRNSTCSTNSSVSNGKNSRTNPKHEKKKKQWSWDSTLFGGCKCSVNAAETVPSRIVRVKSANEAHGKEEKEESTKKTKQHQGKQTLSRHRTFEWLKQLYLEEAQDVA